MRQEIADLQRQIADLRIPTALILSENMDVTHPKSFVHERGAHTAKNGLLDDTLVIWASAFGRTPVRQEGAYMGRDHHPKAHTIWMAGGGIKPGIVYGATDELGYNIAENPVSVHDINATILPLLGIDRTKLTYKFAGRNFRLTDVEGEAVKPLLA